MARCINCGEKGMFLKVNANGLCDQCFQSRLQSLFILAHSSPGQVYSGDVPRGLSPQSVMRMLSDSFENSMRIIVSSGKIINESSYPPTFYERMDLLKSHLEYLVSIQAVDSSLFPKVSPVALRDEYYRSYPLDEEKMWRRYFDQTMDRIVDMKTDRGKQNAITKFFDVVSQYEPRMQDNTKHAIEGFRKRLDLNLHKS